jgi:hypothetical protein
MTATLNVEPSDEDYVARREHTKAQTVCCGNVAMIECFGCDGLCFRFGGVVVERVKGVSHIRA